MGRTHTFAAALLGCTFAFTAQAEMVTCSARQALYLDAQGSLAEDDHWARTQDGLRVDLSHDTLQRRSWEYPLDAHVTWVGPDVMRVDTTFHSVVIYFTSAGISYSLQDARRIVTGTCTES